MYRINRGNQIIILSNSWCYARGKNVWKTWKRRYYALVQVSQYCFAVCSYRDKKSEPTEMMPLEGYTVDYAEPDNGKYFLLEK